MPYYITVPRLRTWSRLQGPHSGEMWTQYVCASGELCWDSLSGCLWPPEGQILPNNENQYVLRHLLYKCVYQIWCVALPIRYVYHVSNCYLNTCTKKYGKLFASRCFWPPQGQKSLGFKTLTISVCVQNLRALYNLWGQESRNMTGLLLAVK